MSKQTDELLQLTALDAPDPEIEQQQKELRNKDVARARERLSLLMSLQQHPGYSIVQDALEQAVDDAFRIIGNTDNPTSLARAAGMHIAATSAHSYVTEECKRLRAFLMNTK